MIDSAAAALVSDQMVEEVCVFGPPSMCREQLAAFHDAGAAMPVLAVSPVNEERLSCDAESVESAGTVDDPLSLLLNDRSSSISTEEGNTETGKSPRAVWQIAPKL